MTAIPNENVDPIPLRALNQVTYCERLYFLEYVEAVMPINEYVEDGTFLHRRVTDPFLQGKPRREEDTIHTRSLALGSEKLGLTGVLDVVEEKGDHIYPVEYKRGSAPRGDDGKPFAWANDAVQLCAQGMLLEEHIGQAVPFGVLFYHGTRERIRIPLDDLRRAQVQEAIQKVREINRRTTPPAPLPHSQRDRCEGCSLVTVCLPEETLYQIGLPASSEDEQSPALTRVIPKSDEGAVLYLNEPGSHVSKRSEHLVVKRDGEERVRVPIAQVRQVVIFGNIQMTTQALECLAFHEVPVMYLNSYGRFIAAFQPAPAKNVSLREQQYERFARTDERLFLAKAVVAAKVANQRTLLMRWVRAAEETTERGRDEPAARSMLDLMPRIADADNIDSLLGLEGQAAALYFAEFARFLKSVDGEKVFDFQSRNRRPPRDPVNALLSFAYAILSKDCFSAACTVGFDPYRGFYHEGRHGRPSLALDLMEEFRPIIADSVVVSLINNGTVSRDDFLIRGNSCQLTDKGRKAFFQAWEQRKAVNVKHPQYGYTMTYSRMLEVQARMLAAYVKGDVPRYVGFTVR